MKTRLLRIVPLGLLISTLVGFAGEPQGAASPSSLLVGTWKLVSCESRFEDGKVEPTLGIDPIGQLMYDANGRMSVHLMRRDRAAFASSDLHGATPQEAKAAFDVHQSYFGSYTMDLAAGTVSHHIEGGSFPNWTGTTQKRFFKLEGKRLSLSTAAIPIDGKQVRLFLIWERVN
jgi:hypothetical protein